MTTNDWNIPLYGTLSAPLAAGEVVRIYEDSTFIGNATVSGTSWTRNLSIALDGTHTYTARIVDEAGNRARCPTTSS